MYEEFYIHEKILCTRNCRRKFIKNLLPEKRKENMRIKQPRFKSRLNKNVMNIMNFAIGRLYFAKLTSLSFLIKSHAKGIQLY